MAAELDDADRSLVEAVVGDVAPDEVQYARQLIAPASWRSRFRGKAIGYGVANELAVIAPYAILVAMWARSVVVDEAKAVTEQRLRALTRRFLGVRDDAKSVPPARPATLNHDELLAATKSYAIILGMKAEDAETLAQAVTKRVLAD